MLNSTIANFFAIVLQYNSKNCTVASILKKKYFFIPFSPKISLLYLIIQLSSLSSFSLSQSALSSLQTQTPFSSQHTSHITVAQFFRWVAIRRFCGCFFFFLVWLTAWVIVVVMVFFFFFGCDRCLKGLWVVVGSSVWVMVGSGVWVVVEVGWVRYLGLVLWLKWVGSGVWVMVGSVGWDWLMVGLKQWICWSVGGSVGLIIGSSDGGSGDDFF